MEDIVLIKDQKGFKGTGNWYKGNLHSHTTNSDGKLSPEDAVALFRAFGYHFLCFSEHDRYTDYREQFDCENFIILPGLEASANLWENAQPGKRLKVHHIHGILGTERMQEEAGERKFKHMEFLEPMQYTGEWDGAAAAQEFIYTKGI